MELEFQRQANILIVGAKERLSLNYGNIETFKSQALANFRAGDVLILDLSKLDFIDSTGLAALIYLRKKVLEGRGDLKLARVAKLILKLMEITRLHRVFDIYDSVEAAIDSIQSQRDKSESPQPLALRIQVKRTERFALVRIEGSDSLLAANSAQFRQEMHEYLDQHPAVILNLDAIRKIDSTGIASLIHLKAYARKRGKKIILVYSNRVLVRLFALYSLEQLFQRFENEEDAMGVVDPSFLKRLHVQEERSFSPEQPEKSRPKPQLQPSRKPQPRPRPEAEVTPVGSEFEDVLFLTNRIKHESTL